MRRRLIQAVFVAILALIPVIASAQSTVTTSGFQVQNLSQSAAANIEIQYINEAGETVARQTDSIPAGGSKTYFDGNGGTVAMAAPAGFRGSVVISSDQQVVAITNLIGQSGTASIGEAYSGFNEGFSAVSIPLVVRNNFGSSTTIVVQNTGSSTTTAKVIFTPGVVGTAAELTKTIPAGASATFSQGAAEGAPLGTRFVGSARVEAGTGGSIVATVVQEGNNQLLSYSAFNANVTPSSVAVPLIVANNFGAFTGLQVANNGAATQITVTYAPNTITGPTRIGNVDVPACPTPTARTYDLGAGASRTIIQSGLGPETEGFDLQFASCRYVGGATVTSSNGQPLQAIVNQVSGRSASSYEGFQVNAASAQVRVPLIASNNFGNFTGLQVQNVGGAAAQVTITYGPNTITGVTRIGNRDVPACPTPTARVVSVAANASITQIQAGGGTEANGFDLQFANCRYVGSATVTAPAGSKIVAITNQVAPLTDGLFTYNGFGL